MISEIAPSLFEISEIVDGRRYNQYLLSGGVRNLLVDVGFRETPTRTLLPALAELGVDPGNISYVLVTHADIDHCGGLRAMSELAPRALSLCGVGDRLMVEDPEVLISDRYRELSLDHGIDESDEFYEWVRANGNEASIDLEVESLKLTLDPEWTVDVARSPGHTQGSLAVHDGANRTVIIGDAVLGRASIDAAGVPEYAPVYRDADSYLATLQRLRALEPECVLASHFPPLRGQRLEEFWVESEHFWWTLHTALIAVLRGSGPLSTKELIAAVAPEVRIWPETMDYSLAATVVGHLESHVRTGLAERHLGDRTLKWRATAGKPPTKTGPAEHR